MWTANYTAAIPYICIYIYILILYQCYVPIIPCHSCQIFLWPLYKCRSVLEILDECIILCMAMSRCETKCIISYSWQLVLMYLYHIQYVFASWVMIRTSHTLLCKFIMFWFNSLHLFVDVSLWVNIYWYYFLFSLPYAKHMSKYSS